MFVIGSTVMARVRGRRHSLPIVDEHGNAMGIENDAHICTRRGQNIQFLGSLQPVHAAAQVRLCCVMRALLYSVLRDLSA